MPSVFLSYSHKDEVWKDRLKTHLGVLDLDTWDDRRIQGGADWLQEIEDAVTRVSVAVLLISVDFLTSEFIRGEEVPRLLEQRRQEGMIVLPVIVRSCAWQEIGWLREIQARPLDGQPLASFRGDHRDAEMANIAREIRRMLTEDRVWGRDRPNRRDDFLSRVATLCRHHESEATVERFPAPGSAGPYLRVTRLKGNIKDVYPVGAIEHGLSRESFQAFLDQIDLLYRKHDAGLISTLVYGSERAPQDLLQEAEEKRVHLVSFVEFQGLIDFRAYLGRQTGRLAADPVYPPRLYVPQRMRFQEGPEESETDDALGQVREWLRSPLGRFIVLLGDFGTGKTFLLQELARRMGEEGDGLVPILLQMRSLEKGRSLDALIGQHFGQERMEVAPDKFRYMLEQGRIALLFDGFDELALRVTYAKAADHFATLLQAAAGNAKVVLTSRRQHFLSESQVKTALAERVESLAGHRLAILQPFHREQVHLFLVNFFDGDEEKAAARLDLINRVRDLLGLSANPRLLGFIADLPEEQLLAACAEGGEITAAKLYELLLDRWLGFEFERVHPKGAPPGLSIAERWKAVTLLAMRLWQKADRFVSLSDLSEEAARVVQAVGPSAPDAEVAAFQVGSGTLLVRDDEGNFAFLHQSILEWLVAKNAAEVLARGGGPDPLGAREISPLMADFFASLAGREQAVAWAKNVLAAPAGESTTKNALLILERQKEEIREKLNLAGQNLRGQDYSGQDLSGADLSGADLTEARLVGTRLAAARLVQVTLRDSDLGEAVLTGADLTEANLTGARLLGTDLRGACFTGTSLRRTRLLGAALDAGSLNSADISGAAMDLLELSPQSGAAGEVFAVVWSPDGEFLASTAGSVIRLWDAQNGREIRAFAGHQGTVRSVAFSPDGKSLAGASDDQTVRIWQVDSGREFRAFAGHQGPVWSIAFSPDGKRLASASDDSTVRIWQVDSGREIRTFAGHQGPVWSIAFSPDGRSVASGSSDCTVRLWQIDWGREIRAFAGHRGPVRSVAFSPDGELLISGSYDDTVRLWRIDPGREIRTFGGFWGPVKSVAFSPDGKSLASGSGYTVRLWQIDSLREIRTFDGHWGSVMSVAFSPDGKRLASGSEDNTVRLWQIESGRETRAFAGHHNLVMSMTFSPDGKELASGLGDNTVRLWQVNSGKETRAFARHQGSVTSVAFSPDGRSIASGSEDNTVCLWQVQSKRELGVFAGHHSTVRSVVFSPDGRSIASGSSDNTVHLWQVESGREIRAFVGHKDTVWGLAFSPSGEKLASGSRDTTIRIWQVDSGREIKAFVGHHSTIRSVAFSPDGECLASGSSDNTVRLWQVDSGREIRAFAGHRNPVQSVAFSPDGKTLASGSADQTVRLWHVSSGHEVRVLNGHRGPVVSVIFSPDRKTLASGSHDGTIRLWNAADGHCLAVLLSLPEGWVAFSPDGRYKFGGVPAGGFWHAVNLCRFEIGELDEWVPGLRLPDDASFFDLPPWKPEVRVPERIAKARKPQ